MPSYGNNPAHHKTEGTLFSGISSFVFSIYCFHICLIWSSNCTQKAQQASAPPLRAPETMPWADLCSCLPYLPFQAFFSHATVSFLYGTVPSILRLLLVMLLITGTIVAMPITASTSLESLTEETDSFPSQILKSSTEAYSERLQEVRDKWQCLLLWAVVTLLLLSL